MSAEQNAAIEGQMLAGASAVTVRPGQTLIIRYVEKALPDRYARDMDEHIAQVHEWFTAEEARIEAKLPGVKVVFVGGDEIAVYDPEPTK